MSARHDVVGAWRSDLAHVKPLYYPFVEQKRFGSVKALCNSLKWDLATVEQACQRAAVELSDVVVIDTIRLGNPDEKNCALLLRRPGGAVVLCVAMFGRLTDDRNAAEAMIKEFAKNPETKDKLLGVGEFRPNPQRAAS